MSSINYIPWNLRMSCLLIVGFLAIAPVSLPAQSIATGFGDVVYDGAHFYAVVKQQHQVAKLDQSGAVLSRYGRQGRGPGEFSTHQLKLALGDSLLYVLDDRGMTVTALAKKHLQLERRQTINKPASDIIFYRDKIYGLVTDFEQHQPLEDGFVMEVFREVGRLDDPKATLFS